MNIHDISLSRLRLKVILTCLADLRGAAAASVAHDGYKASIQAGTTLLAAAAAHRAERRVRLAAVCTLRRVDVTTHTGAL